MEKIGFKYILTLYYLKIQKLLEIIIKIYDNLLFLNIIKKLQLPKRELVQDYYFGLANNYGYLDAGTKILV